MCKCLKTTIKKLLYILSIIIFFINIITFDVFYYYSDLKNKHNKLSDNNYESFSNFNLYFYIISSLNSIILIFTYFNYNFEFENKIYNVIKQLVIFIIIPLFIAIFSLSLFISGIQFKTNENKNYIKLLNFFLLCLIIGNIILIIINLFDFFAKKGKERKIRIFNYNMNEENINNNNNIRNEMNNEVISSNETNITNNERERILNRIKERKKEKLLSISKKTKYKKNKYLNVEDCRICLDKFIEKDEILILPCLHIFHLKCILHWIESKGTCPLDNQKIV
jgi:hypothetical protein